MMKTRWIAGVVLVAALAAPAARADEASKEAKVHELFVTMHMDHMMDQMMQIMKDQVQQMVHTTDATGKMTPAQKKLTDEYMARTMKMTMDSLGWSAIEPEYTKLYAATYTESEIDAITVFYKSPAGQTMLAKTPELSAGAMKIVQAKMVDFQPKMKEMQDEFTKQMLEAMPPPLPPPPPPPPPVRTN